MADAQNLTADAMATQLKALYGSGLKPGFPHEPGVLLVLSDTGRQALDALPDSPAIVLDTVAGNDTALVAYVHSGGSVARMFAPSAFFSGVYDAA